MAEYLKKKTINGVRIIVHIEKPMGIGKESRIGIWFERKEMSISFSVEEKDIPTYLEEMQDTIDRFNRDERREVMDLINNTKFRIDWTTKPPSKGKHIYMDATFMDCNHSRPYGPSSVAIYLNVPQAETVVELVKGSVKMMYDTRTSEIMNKEKSRKYLARQRKY